MLELLPDIFEIMMILCFGVSWPFNITRAYKARTTKGTSIVFTLCVLVGYVAGVLSKILAWIVKGNGYWTFIKIFAFIFYVVNLSMIITALAIYFRNKKLDKNNEKQGE